MKEKLNKKLKGQIFTFDLKITNMISSDKNGDNDDNSLKFGINLNISV